MHLHDSPTPNGQLCPCGSSLGYDDCCGQYLDDGHNAPTAEALMRSRYTAFVMRRGDYLLATWDKSKRPPKLDLTQDPTAWQKLEIVACTRGGRGDDKGVVEFAAHYQLDGVAYVLRETSRFAKRAGQWLYVDGVAKVAANNPAGQTGPALNAPCACGSGKKFKRCCGVGG